MARPAALMPPGHHTDLARQAGNGTNPEQLFQRLVACFLGGWGCGRER